MKITKLLGFIVFLSFLGLSCEKDKENNEQSALANAMKEYCTEITVDLIAGQWTDVGSVTAVVDEAAGTLTVTYNVDGPWCMSLTHLDVQLDPVNFPVGKNGNPKIGHFAYSATLNCATSWTQVVNLIPLGYTAGQMVYIAAHADVEGFVGGDCDLEDFASTLPDCANLVITGAYVGAPAYCPTETITMGGDLDGVYEGWCVDLDHGIAAYTDYTVAVYSSYEELPDCAVDKPENFPYVNWILNQFFVGTPSSSFCGGANYTYGDVQWAIWQFVDDGYYAPPGPNASECKALEIYNLAVASGAGYVPGCGDRIAVVLVPVETCGDECPINQVTIIDVPFESYGSETAWGEGPYQFNPDAGWAMYFSLDCPN